MMRLALRFFCAGAAVAVMSTADAQPRDPRRWNFDERYYRENELPEVEKQGTKVCSVYVPNNWRDSFAVPVTWHWSDCRDYAIAMGATHIHFGCLFDDGEPKFSFGGPGDPPEPNCGWGRRRR